MVRRVIPMIRLDGKIDKTELDNLVKLMSDLKFTEEQKYQMYFMTYDDPYFVESFMTKCANLPANHKTVRDYIDMMAYDVESPITKPVYECFRKEAKYTPPYVTRKVGVIENYTKNVIDTPPAVMGVESKPKIKIKMKG